MIERRPATEDEVICAFLQAELNSDRWAPRRVNPALEGLGFDRSLIDVPNLNDPMENRRRKQVLTACGRGLPLDLTWRLVDLEASDFETMQYMADRNWIEFLKRNTPRVGRRAQFPSLLVTRPTSVSGVL